MSSVKDRPLRWRSLPAGIRLGLTLLCAVLGGGLVASAAFMMEHYEPRDGEAGFGVDDVRGHYHGLDKPAPLLAVLEDGHAAATGRPELDVADEGLTDEERAALIEWLESDDPARSFDSLELGDAAPAEILDRRCVACHARQPEAADHPAPDVPLIYWDDVAKLSVSRSIEPADPTIVLASLHTHSVSLATMALVIVLLGAGTRAPSSVLGVLSILVGLGLLVDMGSWLPARSDVRFVHAIIAGGATSMGASGLLLVIVVIDLWWPGRRPGSSG